MDVVWQWRRRVAAGRCVSARRYVAGVLVVATVILAGFGGRAMGQCEPVWSPQFKAGQELNGNVTAVAELDPDGSGPAATAVFVGGNFTYAGETALNHIAVWDGAAWHALGGGLNGPVFAMAVFDADGEGPGASSLYVAGDFTLAGSTTVSGIARWDGSSWHDVGGGVSFGTPLTQVFALRVFDVDGAGPGGPVLVAGGSFTVAGVTAAAGIAAWNGSAWSALGGGVTGGLFPAVYALEVFDEDGAGPNAPVLVAGGAFADAGGIPSSNIAKWNGLAWLPLGSGVGGPVGAMVVDDLDQGGPGSARLFVGGSFSTAGGGSAQRIAEWDGSAWSALGGGVTGSVAALAVYDSDGGGPKARELYVGGAISGAGGSPVRGVARWDGIGWSDVDLGTDSTVLALATADVDGGGPGGSVLIAGGDFAVAGTGSASRLASWDGDQWRAIGDVGGGMNAPIGAMTVAAVGGEANAGAYIGGQFTSAGRIGAARVVRWGGQEYAPLGSGTDGVVQALAPFDADGPGAGHAVLTVGGIFASAGGVGVNNIAAWNGAAWQDVGGGVTGTSFPQVRALLSVDHDGAGAGLPRLYVGGRFTMAGATPASRVAYWDGAAWHAMGGGVDGTVFSLLEWDEDGAGPNPASLYVGGSFFSADGGSANGVARWDGSAWHALGAGVDGMVMSMAVFDEDGAGPLPPALFVSGSFETAGVVPALNIAKWNGAAWSAVGGGLDSGARSLLVFDATGSGQNVLVAGGDFVLADGNGADSLAYWDGTAWHELGGGVAGKKARVAALSAFDADGAGTNAPALLVGGGVNAAGGMAMQRLASWGPPAPFVVQGPQSREVVSGGSLQMTVLGGGAPSGGTITYQWRRDNDVLVTDARTTGVNGPVLAISPVTPGDAGDYDVVISNDCGEVVTNSAAVTVFCKADIDHNGIREPLDVSIYVNMWLDSLVNGNLHADFDGNGLIEPADIALFINKWLAAPENC